MAMERLGAGGNQGAGSLDAAENTAVADEVRRWTRFSDERLFAVITTDGGSRTVEVLDESFGGIGVEMESRGDIELDMEVMVQYRTGPMAGTVRFLADSPGGKTRAGIEWRKPPRPYL